MSVSASTTQYAIIGMGAAGLAAASTIRQRDPSSGITIATNDARLYYSRPGLAYLLAGEIPPKGLYPFSDKAIRGQSFKILAEEVISIDPENCRLLFAGKRQIHYDRLLIATGALALMPDLPGIQLDGVVKLDNYTDAEKILKNARRAKTAVVVGGGITAIELVEGLVAQGVSVHYFLRGERYWSGVLDEVESRIVERRLAADRVQIHFFTELKEVVGKRGRVTGVQAVEKGNEIFLPCQILAVAIGIQPRIQLAVTADRKSVV